MKTATFLAVALLVFGAPAAQADVILDLSQVGGSGGTFAPGDTLTFDVALKGVTNLTDYQLTLMIQGNSDLAPLTVPTQADGRLDDLPSISRYVFFDAGTTYTSTTSGYTRAENLNTSPASPPFTLLALTILDSGGPSTTVDGSNDLVARATVQVGAAYMGSILTFSFDTGSNALIVDNVDGPVTPGITYNGTAGNGITLRTRAVPEPGSIAMVAQGLIVSAWIVGRRRRRSA